jgi:hypothetical protein
MARGSSGRIVLEIDPSTKDRLYLALAKRKLTLKDWFLNQCSVYIQEADQPSLFPEEVSEKQQNYLKE